MALCLFFFFFTVSLFSFAFPYLLMTLGTFPLVSRQCSLIAYQLGMRQGVFLSFFYVLENRLFLLGPHGRCDPGSRGVSGTVVLMGLC